MLEEKEAAEAKRAEEAKLMEAKKDQEAAERLSQKGYFVAKPGDKPGDTQSIGNLIF